MAKLKLKTPFKSKLYSKMHERLLSIGLCPTTQQASNTAMNLATVSGFFTGEKEVLDIKWVSGTGQIGNSLHTDYKPLLIFTVANGEQPKEYHLLYKDSSSYYRDVIVTTSQSTANFDTAIQLSALEIEFKGDGE